MQGTLVPIQQMRRSRNLISPLRGSIIFMAQLLLTHSSFHRTFHPRGEFPLGLKIGKFFLFFGMTFMIGLVSFFYLMKFTEIHTKGYELKKLERERDKLMTVREVHGTNIAALKSLNAVRGSDAAGRMVPMKPPVFLRTDGSVALLGERP